MLLQITVGAKDLEEISKILSSEGKYTPSNQIPFEIKPVHLVINDPIRVFVTYDEWLMLEDFMEINETLPR